MNDKSRYRYSRLKTDPSSSLGTTLVTQPVKSNWGMNPVLSTIFRHTMRNNRKRNYLEAWLLRDPATSLFVLLCWSRAYFQPHPNASELWQHEWYGHFDWEASSRKLCFLSQPAVEHHIKAEDSRFQGTLGQQKEVQAQRKHQQAQVQRVG